MKCPKCFEEMEIGEIAYINGKGELFWAPEDFFREKICNLYTKRSVIKNGGMDIPLGNGITNDRTKGHVCRKCNFILIDCNK